MILVTTSDYLPKIGGLSTFTDNIEKTLKKLNIEYDVFHWKNFDEISRFDAAKLKQYESIINIHPMFTFQKDSCHEKMINFVHGSEVLMTSPNPFKRIFKRVKKNNYYGKLSSSRFNIYISEYTLNKIESLGYPTDYSKDLVFHNCIDLKNSTFIEKNLQDENWTLCCFVRNVPHKNLVGAVELAEIIQEITNKKIKLLVPKNSGVHSNKVSIEELKDFEVDSIEEAYKKAHFNLLMSLDHSKKGFVEGFGLTVLEAGKFGVPSLVFQSGGLSEAVHDKKTGFVFKDISFAETERVLNEIKEFDYQTIQKNVFNHTHGSHGLDQYEKLLIKLLGIKL